jgi:sugar lactone lactonase YvrE
MLSENIRDGGMIDGNLRRVVMFPDDGHPDGVPVDASHGTFVMAILASRARSPHAGSAVHRASTPQAQPTLQRIELSHDGIAARTGER